MICVSLILLSVVKMAQPLVIHCSSEYACRIPPNLAGQLNDDNVNDIQLADPDRYNTIRVLEILYPTGLTTIPRRFLQRFAVLYNVRLIRIGISSLSPSDFQSSSALKDLNLSRNRLIVVPANAFFHATSLTYINLASNQITDLHLNAFRGLSSLQHLSLSQNRIRTVPSSLFDGASNIEELHLDNNLIETVEPIKLPALRTISLADNKIVTLSSDTFAQTPRVESIDLSSNDLMKLSNDMFDRCTHLYALHLDNNKQLNFDLGDVAAIMGKAPLTQLSLDNTMFRLTGAKDHDGILDLLKLSMRSNLITNPSVLDILAHFFPNLKEIDLSHNRFSAINNVQNARQLFPSLRRFGFAGNNLSQQAMESMRSTMTAQNIEFIVDDDQLI